jgi:hypothetical protein
MLVVNFDKAIETFHDTGIWVRFAVIISETAKVVGMT